MARLGPIRFAALVPLLLVVGLLAPPAGAVPPVPASRLAPQWHLDIEKALDAIGLAPGMVVGEAGAGDGYFTIPMARRVGPSGIVFANDISTRALRSLEQSSAREGLANIRTVVGEVDDPRFPQRDLQLVVVVHAFHDFSRPVEWLVNLKAYLRPGATVAIIDRDPAQGAEAHFWPRERIERYAAEAGYERAMAVDDISSHLILVLRPTRQ
jgi:ubiquinone/menaquinone biosynthesis C-methylase UbiE